jgi:hypothetical protein
MPPILQMIERDTDASSLREDRPSPHYRERTDSKAIVFHLLTSSGEITSDLHRPFTPYCGLKLAELAQQFFPPGVFQALSGDDNLGPWLTSHDGIDKVSFTGSTATGKLVMQSCAKTLKRVTLEL